MPARLKLMLRPSNILILDEPTNDLDMATLAVLEECLSEFDGAVILVSHDRFFLGQVCNRILAFPPQGGRLVSFADLGQWEAWHAEEAKTLRSVRKPETAARAAETGMLTSPDPMAGTTPRKKKLSYKDQRDLDTIEQRIAAAEQHLARATAESALPENMSNSVALARLSKEMADAQAEIDRLYARWAELEA